MTILIADDDKSIIAALKLLLNSENIESEACMTPADVLARISEKSFQLALIDLNYQKDTTSGVEGLELISNIRQIDEFIPIVVMTGWGTINIAVDAMQRGASDFIEKPWDDNNRLLSIIRSQITISESLRREKRLSAENQLLKQQVIPNNNMIADSPAMQKVLNLAQKVARSDIPILICGENGTGKSLLAHYIHDCSPRNNASLITVNMGGIYESTFESEMFGHVKGAFTDAKSDRIGRVELAEDGTLFLDEIANTPLSQQAKMLRLLEEKEYEKLGGSRVSRSKARFISATNTDLETLVSEQGFRQDLLYRLNGITITLPPLRERKADIHLLAQQFLQTAITHCDSIAEDFAEETLEVMQSYSWPGNVRELNHVVERAALLSQEKLIQVEDLQLPKIHQASSNIGTENIVLNKLVNMTLDEAESYLIKKALEDLPGDAEQAAEKLGLSRSAFYRRLQKYGISL